MLPSGRTATTAGRDHRLIPERHHRDPRGTRHGGRHERRTEIDSKAVGHVAFPGEEDARARGNPATRSRCRPGCRRRRVRARGKARRAGGQSPRPGWGYPDPGRRRHSGERAGGAARRRGRVRPWTCGSSPPTGLDGARRPSSRTCSTGRGWSGSTSSTGTPTPRPAWRALLHLHERAVHDCAVRNPVAKVHTYPDQAFVVLHAPGPGSAGTCTSSSSTSSSGRTGCSPCTGR